MPLDHPQFPPKFHHLLNLLEQKQLSFDSQLFNQQPTLEIQCRFLCHWLNNNHLAQREWCRVVINLIGKIKIPILRLLEPAFDKIASCSFLRQDLFFNGFKIFKIIQDILINIDNDLHIRHFRLFTISKLQTHFKDPINFCKNKKMPSLIQVNSRERTFYLMLYLMSEWCFKFEKGVEKNVFLKEKIIKKLMHTLRMINLKLDKLLVIWMDEMNGFEKGLLERQALWYMKNVDEFLRIVQNNKSIGRDERMLKRGKNNKSKREVQGKYENSYYESDKTLQGEQMYETHIKLVKLQPQQLVIPNESEKKQENKNIQIGWDIQVIYENQLKIIDEMLQEFIGQSAESDSGQEQSEYETSVNEDETYLNQYETKVNQYETNVSQDYKNLTEYQIKISENHINHTKDYKKDNSHDNDTDNEWEDNCGKPIMTEAVKEPKKDVKLRKKKEKQKITQNNFQLKTIQVSSFSQEQQYFQHDPNLYLKNTHNPANIHESCYQVLNIGQHQNSSLPRCHQSSSRNDQSSKEVQHYNQNQQSLEEGEWDLNELQGYNQL